MENNTHNHEHQHDKPHNHRALIGFDEHGIPKVIVPADTHTHVDENGSIIEHTHEFTADYMKAVSDYRKTFPSKQEVLDNTPDPAVKQMMLYMEQIGIDTTFDRFDKQQPQCSFGLSGVCCKICNMGPCKVTPKSPKGVCGADADLIVARNLLRSVAAGVAQHGMQAREVVLSLKWAAEGKLDIPIVGEYKIKTMAKAFGIPTAHRQLKNIAIDLANVLLEDLSRTEPNEYRTIKACAPPERQEVWKNLDILPISMDVAKCYKTTVVTTSDSARLPGVEHYAYDHHHSNIGETQALAEKIVTRAIESFKARRGISVFIPPYEVEAETGFFVEYIHKHYGSMKPLAEALKSGKILGIVNMVGCNNPKVVYEKAIIDVADVLIKNNVLILTNGCASFPLMKLGYCNTSIYNKTGDSLKEFLSYGELPPVWHVGECIDNTRSSGIFGGIAGELGKNLYELPFAFSSPEWGNEKGIGAALGFRLMGINSYHCVEAQIHGSAKVIKFLKEDTKSMLGSSMNVDTNPTSLGEKIVQDFKAKREKLGWINP